MVALVHLRAINAHAIRQTVASPATVVKDQDIPFARQPLWDHVHMMLTDDLADLARFLRLREIRAQLPDNLARFLVDDRQDIRFARIPDDIFRLEAFVASVIPFIWPQHTHRIDVHPVAKLAIVREMLVRIAEEHILRRLRKSQFAEMIAHMPFPDNIAFPVHLNEHIVQQLLVADLVIVDRFMAKDQRVAAVRLALHPRHIIADRISLALVIVMLARHPHRLLALVLNVFLVVKFPHNIAVPVQLRHIRLVLIGKRAVACAQRSQHITARQQLVWKALKILPHFHNTPVHIDQDRANVVDRKQRVPVPRLFRIINRCSRRINSWSAHENYLRFFDKLILCYPSPANHNGR